LALVMIGCAGPERDAWRGVRLPPGLADLEVEAAYGLPTGQFLLLGATRSAAGTPAPAMWQVEPRANEWKRYATRTSDIDGRNTRLVAVAAANGGTVAALGFAVGFAHGNARPVLWQTVGDATLEESRLDRELFGGPRGMTVRALAASELGYFATGTWSNRGTERQVAQVWRARALPEWERLEDEPSRLSAVGEQLWGEDVAATASRVVVVGWGEYHAAGGVPDPMDAAAWSSTDGVTFTRAPALRSRGRQAMQFVEATPGGFTAVGSAGGDVVLWTSVDGLAWRGPRTVTRAAVATGTVAAGGTVYVATSGRSGSQLWAAAGGTAEEVPLPASLRGDRVVLAVAGDRLLVVGKGTGRDAGAAQRAVVRLLR
jgi:hypothetical protein